jgi:hypothetical protein
VSLFGTDDKITEYHGMGGQGVFAVPNVYPGWVEKLDLTWDLTPEQRNPLDAIAKYKQQQIEQQQIEQQQIEQQQIEQQKIEQQQIEQQKIEQQKIEQQQIEQQKIEQQKIEQQKIEQQQPVYPELEQQQPVYPELEQQQIEQQKPVYPEQSNNNDAKMDSIQPYRQQETKTPENIADKIAKLRQQLGNQAIAPEIIEEKVNPSLEKVGNIISMLPIPYP